METIKNSLCFAFLLSATWGGTLVIAYLLRDSLLLSLLGSCAWCALLAVIVYKIGEKTNRL